jgi:uncharacterized membrane protein
MQIPLFFGSYQLQQTYFTVSAIFGALVLIAGLVQIIRARFVPVNPKADNQAENSNTTRDPEFELIMGQTLVGFGFLFIIGGIYVAVILFGFGIFQMLSTVWFLRRDTKAKKK